MPGGALRKLGEDITETLELVPAQWKVKVHRYRRGRDDGVLRTRLRALAAPRRQGYRRLHLLLPCEGFAVNHEKLFREERLVVRKRVEGLFRPTLGLTNLQ